MHLVCRDGVRINWRKIGRGEDVVLLHGLAANLGFWSVQLLLPLSRRYRVTVYDLRGHGYSSMPRQDYTPTDMVGDLVDLLDHLEIESAHLVGHSYGGEIALHAAAMHPGRVRSLTLADSRIRALQPTQRLRDWPGWRATKTKFAEHGISIDADDPEAGMRLLEIIASPDWQAKQQLRSQKPLLVPFRGWSTGNRAAAKWLRLLRTTSAWEELRSVGELTRDGIRGVHEAAFAMYGERSKCLPSFDQLSQLLPNCQTLLLPEVGHFFPLIRPRYVAERLLAFLDGQSGDSVDALLPSTCEAVAADCHCRGEMEMDLPHWAEEVWE